MKYFYLFLGIVLLILIIIPFFQLFTYGNYPFPLYTQVIDNTLWVAIVIFMSILAGVFLTLGIKGLLNNNDDIDEWFDL